jgi:hypothetical protein
MITIEFEVAKPDVLALSCHFYTQSPTVRRSMRTTQITISLMLVVLGALCLSGTTSSVPSAFVFFASAAISAVLVPVWYRANLRKTAEKIAETSYQRAFGKYKLVLSEDGITSTSPTGESTHRWLAVNSVALTPEYLFIFLAGPQGYVVPRTQVSAASIADAHAFVQSHISR